MVVGHKTASERLMGLLDRGVTLPPVPSVGVELLSLIRRPAESINIRKVAALVENDPALAARLLRIANSPVYGVVRKVTSVGHALVLIGLEETTGFLNYYLVRAIMPRCPALEHFSTDEFWIHSWACATAAKLLGRPQYLVRSLPGELYLAGLLHDIGKVVLAVHMPQEFQACLVRARESGMPLYRAEREILGVDHATLGAHLLDKWNLPSSILEAVAFHHAPEEASPVEREIAALVQLADHVVNRCEIGDGGTPGENDLADTWISRQGQSPLASTETQQALLKEVTDCAQKKVSLLNPGRLDEEEPDQAEETSDEAQSDSPASEPQIEASQAAEPQGVWARLLTILTSILGK